MYLFFYFYRGRGFRGRARGGRVGCGGRGGRGMIFKGFGPVGQGRGRSREVFMNGFGPIRSLLVTIDFFEFLLKRLQWC